MTIIKNAFSDKNFTIKYRGETIFCAHVLLDNELQVTSKGGHTLELNEVMEFQKWLNEVYDTQLVKTL